ncbi:MAG: mevalonate kinase [Deltaproteobacteria bacterium]|nr:MAG: mevalonate kinase [Deltaproteobacteria bacterium]
MNICSARPDDGTIRSTFLLPSGPDAPYGWRVPVTDPARRTGPHRIPSPQRMSTSPRTTLRSAPGKVLLLGEHAVVHGEPALAAALELAVEIRHEPGNATLRLRDSGGGLDTRPGHPDRVGRALEAILQALPPEAGSGELTVRSSIPPGAGLGSSGALCAALVRVLEAAHDLQLDPMQRLTAALAGERVFHGNASGLDPAASLFGGLIRFVRGTPPSIRPVTIARPLDLVVAQVAPGADTRRMVDDVQRRIDSLPAGGRAILRTIGICVDAAVDCIGGGDLDGLGQAMDMNHGLLTSLGVSTEALDHAVRLARAHGAAGAKLTGAGGGGCIVALARPGRLPDVRSALAPVSSLVHTLTLHPTP